MPSYKPTPEKVSLADVERALNYDAETGIFTWKLPTMRRIVNGARAGSVMTSGYRIITINGNPITEHRLAWMMMRREVPEAYIDHINGKKDDNRWCNLRIASHDENARNAKTRCDNRSGIKGVSWSKERGKWVANINAGKRFHLGAFASLQEAEQAVKQRRLELHGEFAKH